MLTFKSRVYVNTSTPLRQKKTHIVQIVCLFMVICVICVFQGRQIPGIYDVHGLYIMLPGEIRII